MVGLEFDLEHGIRQRLNHRCHDLNRIFLRQSVSISASRVSTLPAFETEWYYSVKIIAPVAVTATVCSK